MNIHEYQAKSLFAANGIPVPEGYLAQSGVEAEFAMRRLGPRSPWSRRKFMPAVGERAAASSSSSPRKSALKLRRRCSE